RVWDGHRQKRFRRGETSLPPHHPAVRRRRRRITHTNSSADFLLSSDARADRARSRIHSSTAAVQNKEGQKRAVSSRREGNAEVPDEKGYRERHRHRAGDRRRVKRRGAEKDPREAGRT